MSCNKLILICEDELKSMAVNLLSEINRIPLYDSSKRTGTIQLCLSNLQRMVAETILHYNERDDAIEAVERDLFSQFT